MKNYPFYLFMAMVLSSCAVHTGMMTGNASLSNGNFKYVGLATGSASTSNFLGLGGLKTDALVFEAKKDMLHNYPLREGQALANVTVDLKKSYMIIFMKRRVMISADVVDFKFDSVPQDFDLPLLKRHDYSMQNKFGVREGDSVYYETEDIISKGVVKEFEDQVVSIKTTDARGKERIDYSFNYATLLINPSKEEIQQIGFRTQEKIKFLDENLEFKSGKIFGVNKEYIGVKYDFNPDGSFTWNIIPISRVQRID